MYRLKPTFIIAGIGILSAYYCDYQCGRNNISQSPLLVSKASILPQRLQEILHVGFLEGVPKEVFYGFGVDVPEESRFEEAWRTSSLSRQ